ncbi:MAG: hypothetical protein ABIQ01_12165 [Pseudolysinimonas sp.]
MSDDTPTQRFPSAESGETPTQQLQTAEAEVVQEEKKSRALLIGLIIAGALLLAAIIAIILVLLPRGDGDPVAVTTGSPTPGETPTATPTPTPTPSETEAPEQPQQPAGPAVDAFSVSNQSVLCNTQTPTPSHQYIAFSWNTSGASQIFFGVDTNDASTNALFANLAPNGTSQNDFPAGYNDFEYGCPAASHKYTLTVVDGNGHKDSSSVTVTNNGDTQ